jgi:hypothetical protein
MILSQRLRERERMHAAVGDAGVRVGRTESGHLPEHQVAMRVVSANHDLVCQQGVAVGDVENGLLGKLLVMICPRATPENDRIVGANDV